uniref:hypothetical protein n=1 Tax=Okeania sp. SIO2F4 TaxID=2607790 RepID=UPI0025F61454
MVYILDIYFEFYLISANSCHFTVAFGIAASSDHVFWTDLEQKVIFRHPLNGQSAPEKLIDPQVALGASTYNPYGIAVS